MLSVCPIFGFFFHHLCVVTSSPEKKKEMGALRIFFLDHITSLGDKHFKEIPRDHCSLNEWPQKELLTPAFFTGGSVRQGSFRSCLFSGQT